MLRMCLLLLPLSSCVEMVLCSLLTMCFLLGPRINVWPVGVDSAWLSRWSNDESSFARSSHACYSVSSSVPAVFQCLWKCLLVRSQVLLRVRRKEAENRPMRSNNMCWLNSHEEEHQHRRHNEWFDLLCLKPMTLREFSFIFFSLCVRFFFVVCSSYIWIWGFYS